jgi:serine/threonine protein kinase
MAKRYKIYERLGEGGSATVYRAYDTQMKRWLAIKRLLPAGSDAQEAAELRAEAGVLASLNHPQIVTVFDVADDEEGLFMVMELLQGDDLADILEQGPLSLEDFRELALQSLAAIHTCHEHRVLHRDLKPANIKIDREASGRLMAKVIDFGISRSGMVARKQTERQDGMILGSVHYMAPEQVGRTACDHRADLYSLGCIFYECLSGRRPVESKNIYELIDKHLTHDITSLQVLCPHLPLELVGWVETGLMALRPEDRYQSALEALEAFRGIDIFSTTALTGAALKRRTSGSSPRPSTTTVVPDGEPGAGGLRAKLPLLAGAAALAVGGWFFLGGDKSPAPGAPFVVVPHAETSEPEAATADTAPQPPTPTPEPSAPPQVKASDLPLENEFKALPERKAAPASAELIAHFSADSGVRGFETTGENKPLRLAEVGKTVRYWHDLATRVKDTPLKTFDNSEDYSPVLALWKGSGIKPQRKVLNFNEPAGGACSMTLYRNIVIADEFSFGTNKTGITWVVVMDADDTRLPIRLGRLVSENSGLLSIRVDDKKRLVLEARSRAAGSSATIISEDFDASKPIIVTIHWDAATQKLTGRARASDGSTYRSAPVNCIPFLKPLRNVELGRVREYTTKEPSLPIDQFHGVIAEVLYYVSPLSTADMDQLESDLADYYFTK